MTMILFFSFYLPAFSSFVAADCQCPVVQCEPCQRPLPLDMEEISCGSGGKIECAKIVCENVDNFFQCLAGEKPLYIPPQNPMTRITEPYDPADLTNKPQPIDFQKLAGPVPQPEELKFQNIDDKDSPKVQVKDIVLPKRDIASIPAEPVGQVAAYNLERKQGRIFLNGQRIRKSSTWKGHGTLKSEDVVYVTIFGAEGRYQLHMSPHTQIEFFAANDILWVSLKKGQAHLKIEKSQVVHALEFGLWRFAKRAGSYQLTLKNGNQIVENKEGKAFLRRNELIAKAEEIGPHKTLTFDPTHRLVAMDSTAQEVNRTLKVSSLSDPQRSIAQEGAFCLQPQADFEQCAWKCFGAHTKAKKCDPSMGAQCVRFTCSGDGLWKMPTLVTTSECSTKEVRVGSCQ